MTGRIWLIKLFVLIFGLILVGRLYYIQIISSETYVDQADKQYVQTGQAVFDRGTIYFSQKSGNLISAATLATGYTVTIHPKKVKQPEDVFNALSGILSIDESVLLAKIENDKSYTEIAKRIDEKTAIRIRDLNLAGVGTYKERWRVYPGGKTGAHTLGFVGFQGDGKTLAGSYGLERYYNDILSRDSSGKYVNFFAKIFSGTDDSFDNGLIDSGDIITTIEPTVLRELETKIASIESLWKSDLTGGIIMDPKTGEIYAMAASPSFDPNDFSKEKDNALFGNHMVDRFYEMGSIIKPLTMAVGLDAGVITLETTYVDVGFVILNGAKISNFDGKGRGTIPMQRVLNESLNTGMAFVAQKLGNQKLSEYFKSFGFGQETGIDLPNEVHGLIKNLESPRDLEHATAAFGQGIAMTPIETIRALSALGNGGLLPNPHIVKQINYLNGDSKILSYDDEKRVLKPETSETITKMLVEVVDKALLGGTVKQKHYSIAAKTGTAQIALEGGRGYYEDRYLHSFFGYFPAYDPKFIIFLFTVNPKGAPYASHTLTMPFIDLAKFLINYYDIPPDR